MAFVAVHACAQQEAAPNPVVASIQARDPQTGEALVAAVRNLLDIGQVDVALGYLEKISRLSLDDSGWFELARHAGSDFMFRLATDPKLQPLGRTVSNQLIEASQRVAHDPARLDLLTRTVANRDIAIRSAALDDLRVLGAVGAAALLNALADPAREADAPFLRRALAEFGAAAIEPIVGGIRAANERLQVEAMRGAASYVSSDLVALLMRPYFQPESSEETRTAAGVALNALLSQTPTQADAQELLKGKIQQHLGAAPGAQALPDESRSVYRLNPETGRLVKLTRPAGVIERMLAAEYAEDLLHIVPGNRSVEHEYLLALLEATKYARGFEVPIWQTPAITAIESMGPAAVTAVLEAALRRDLTGAAMAASEALGRLPESAEPDNDRWGSLVRAARCPDIRVRFAACQALMQLDPAQAFPGCSDVLQSMIELAAGRGRPKVLVTIPRTNEAEIVAATLDKLGYLAEPIASARQLLTTATEDPDVQLILLSDRLNPSVSEVLSHLRNHPKTRRTPVAVLYQTDENVVAQRGGAARQDILAHLVVDGRRFVDYDRWVQAYVNSSLADLHPLLLIVPPGNTATAFGLATQRGQVKFIELSDDVPLISPGFLERVRDAFRLDRPPVCLVIEPVSTSTPRTEVSLSLVLDPAEWADWAQWTRLLHDNPVTNVVDVVLQTSSEVRRFQALDQQVETTEPRTIPSEDIEFLFQLVVNTISTEKALWTAYLDPAAQQRAMALAQLHERVIAVPATLDARLIARQVERLSQWMHHDGPSPPLQQTFAEQAAGWLEQIASHPERYPFWDLAAVDAAVVAIAQSPPVSAAVCRTLGELGTPQAQQQLLLIVEQSANPVAIRQAAAAAFQTAVEKHGIFLTNEQIQRQYERYNSSAALPEEVRAIYAAILNTLEAPSQASQ